VHESVLAELQCNWSEAERRSEGSMLEHLALVWSLVIQEWWSVRGLLAN
jgi:hypothetical protein